MVKTMNQTTQTIDKKYIEAAKALYPNVSPNDKVIFIGVDPRETMAYLIAKHSIEARAKNIKVLPLYAKDLRKAGFYTRPMMVEGTTGQFIDVIEDRPHSVEFSFTRFLVPFIARCLGIKGWVMFADCDFLFRTNLNYLFDDLSQLRTSADSFTIDEPPLALVKHKFESTTKTKMDGCLQRDYGMKLWTAFMCFNVNHSMLDKLVPEYVNSAAGMDLHQFDWLKYPSGEWGIDSIYGLPENYQTIPGHSRANHNWDSKLPPMIIHYTEKAPWFSGDNRNTTFSEEWWDEVEDWKTTIAATPRYTRIWE